MSQSTRTFNPWIGKLYATEGYLGKRLLILGESHYHRNGGVDHPEMTRHIIFGLSIPKGGKFSTRTQRLIVGGRGALTAAHRADFWHRVAFCNYIQTGLPGPRMRPTHEMWSAAPEPLYETLRELNPQVVIVLGVALSRNLPPIAAEISVCRVPHHSSFGFTYSPWHSKIHAALTGIGDGQHRL